MAKKKLSEKIADAVDHVLHPDAEKDQDFEKEKAEVPAESEPEKVQSVPLHEQHLAMHPKFDKFKATGEKHQ